MNRNLKATEKEIQALVRAWRIIEHDYSDGEYKEAAQKIIDELLIGMCEDIADWYDDNAES